jgi:hypothetical protein
MWSYPQYYNLNYGGILKLSQWTKLFIKFISSRLQILYIFEIWEGSKLEL